MQQAQLTFDAIASQGHWVTPVKRDRSPSPPRTGSESLLPSASAGSVSGSSYVPRSAKKKPKPESNAIYKKIRAFPLKGCEYFDGYPAIIKGSIAFCPGDATFWDLNTCTKIDRTLNFPKRLGRWISGSQTDLMASFEYSGSIAFLVNFSTGEKVGELVLPGGDSTKRPTFGDYNEFCMDDDGEFIGFIYRSTRLMIIRLEDRTVVRDIELGSISENFRDPETGGVNDATLHKDIYGRVHAVLASRIGYVHIVSFGLLGAGNDDQSLTAHTARQYPLHAERKKRASVFSVNIWKTQNFVRIVSGGLDNQLVVSDFETGREIQRIPTAHKMGVHQVGVWAEDGVALTGSGDDVNVKVWELESGKRLKILKLRDGTPCIRRPKFDIMTFATGESRVAVVSNCNNTDEDTVHVLKVLE